MPEKDNDNPQFTLTEDGTKFLQMIKKIINSNYPERYLKPRCKDVCLDAIDAIESRKGDPRKNFFEIYTSLNVYIPIEIPLWEILHEKTTLEGLREKASILTSLSIAISLYRNNIDRHNPQLFFTSNTDF